MNVLRRMRTGIRERIRGSELQLMVGTLIVLFVFVYFFNSIVIAVHAGEGGVLWSRVFGTLTNRVYPEGTHLILPWNEMTIYNLRHQTAENKFHVLSRDGLDIEIEATVRYKPVDRLIARLHKEVGPDYLQKIVLPEVHSALRAVVSRYRPEELYAASFLEIQQDVVQLARGQVRNRYVLIDDVLLKAIILPPPVARAIQQKLEEEQRSLEMQYRIARERQEAERKRIEAEGIRDYQTIVASSLNEELLRHKGIEATLSLAQSNNAKVVVVGGANGLPLILNTETGAVTRTSP